MQKSIVLLFLSAITSFMLISCSESLEDRAEREAREQTRRDCPFPLSKDLTMDSVVFQKTSHTFIYYYSLSPKFDGERMDVPTIKEELKTQLRNMTALRHYKNAGYSFRYIYYSLKKPEEYIVDATFTAQDYK